MLMIINKIKCFGPIGTKFHIDQILKLTRIQLLHQTKIIIYFLDINTGKEIKKIPTELVNFSNKFINNIIVNEKNIFF